MRGGKRRQAEGKPPGVAGLLAGSKALCPVPFHCSTRVRLGPLLV